MKTRLRPQTITAAFRSLNRKNLRVVPLARTARSICLAAISLLFFVFALGAASLEPHHFNGITVLPNETVQLSLTGRVSSAFFNYFDLYLIEASADLRDWNPLTTLLKTNKSSSPLNYLDLEAASLSRRFYRTATNHLITAIPKPTGPYPVGTVSRQLTDPARPYRLPFMISIWYPAVAVAGSLPGVYLDQQIAGDAFYIGASLVEVFMNAHGHSLPNVPVANGVNAYPVVIYSHGNGGNRRENTDKVENLASHGYVVAAIDHADSYGSVFPDGRIIYGFRPETAVADLERRVKDVQFVMDELSRLQVNDPTFSGRLDLARVGVFGHSFGGATSATVGAIDSRCGAVATLDGGAGVPDYVDLLGATITKPIVIMSGTVETESLFLAIRASFRALFDQRTQPNAYWMSVANTTHGDFIHNPWFYSPTDSTKTRAAIVIRDYLLSFFNKHLKGQDDHLLDGRSTAYPEVIQFLKK